MNTDGKQVNSKSVSLKKEYYNLNFEDRIFTNTDVFNKIGNIFIFMMLLI